KPSAAPRNSARSVAIAETSAATHKNNVIGREKCFLQFCGSVSPVTTPILAERYWISIAIAFDHSKTHSSRYPNLLPPSIFVAKLPGSIYATEATNAGPKYVHISFLRNLPGKVGFSSLIKIL